MNFIEEKLFLYKKSLYIFKLLNLGFFCIFTAHICGCLLFLIAKWQISIGNSNTWINNHNIVEENWKIQYLESLYYTILTMISASTLQIHSPIEKFFSLFIVLALSFIFAYLLNTVGTILNEYNEETKLIRLFYHIYKKKNISICCNIRSKLKVLMKYMKRKNISKELQFQVRRYIEYLHNEENEDFQKGQTLIKTLPNDMQNKILIENNKDKIFKYNFFKMNFSEEFLQNLCLKVNELTFSPEEVIFDVRFFLYIY